MREAVGNVVGVVIVVAVVGDAVVAFAAPARAAFACMYEHNGMR